MIAAPALFLVRVCCSASMIDSFYGCAQHFRIRDANRLPVEKGNCIFHALAVELHPSLTDAVAKMRRQYRVGCISQLCLAKIPSGSILLCFL